MNEKQGFHERTFAPDLVSDSRVTESVRSQGMDRISEDSPATPAELGAQDWLSPELQEWFAARGWSPFGFQLETWEHQRRGRSGLVQVPTGAGKTFAAFLGALAEAAGDLRSSRRGLKILYITPLKAVSRDVQKAMTEAVEGAGLDWSVECRTGDTTQTTRRRQRERLPEVLLTTPESLSLLLSQPEAETHFSDLRYVILDEWHELVRSKRGTQTELACARLRRFSPSLQTWALSATLASPEGAMRHALGAGHSGVIVTADLDRPILLEALLPSDSRSIPWAGHMGLRLKEVLTDWLDPEVSTIVFCNTRSQAELWYHAIRHSKPDWEAVLGLHHGSIDRKERERVEHGLKSGEIRIAVATSSLDLGVDFAPVERVVQIGSPKGVSRLIQRAGRAKHRPGVSCSIMCLPTSVMHLFEIEAVRGAIADRQLEPMDYESKPLDVLAQHLVTCALGGGFTPDELFEEVRGATAFAPLTREEFDWALRLVVQGGGTLSAYPEFCKIELGEDNRYRSSTDRIGLLHRMNIGTITSDPALQLKYENGRTIGTIEERFIDRLRVGQAFVFAGLPLSLKRVRHGTAVVRPAKSKTRLTPHWSGTRLPITEVLGQRVREALERASVSPGNSNELAAAMAYVSAQQAVSVVPKGNELLIESLTHEEGESVFIYPFAGTLVHSAMAALVALRISRLETGSFELASNDYGFEVLCPSGYPIEDLFIEHALELLTADGLLEDTAEALDLGQLSKRQFREVARVAGLVVQNAPGAGSRGRKTTVSSSLIYDVLRDFDPGHLLLKQAEREVLEREFERGRLRRELERMRSAPRISRRIVDPSPFCMPIMLERKGAVLSNETADDRIAELIKLAEMG